MDNGQLGRARGERGAREHLLSARRVLALAALVSGLMPLTGTPAHAWSLRTHMWIAQQVINDIAVDCRISVVVAGAGERSYSIRQDVCDAIRAHPQVYRAGSLGPDSFPDLLVGQMTTHPGVEGGWPTDRWLNHVLQAANSSEEVAFAYGFVAHAAGDVFAHSYVNHYAGDIFTLADHESAVELRHFSLEKYIDSRTPLLVQNGAPVPYAALDVPKRFLSRTLIYNESVARQYVQAKFGVHLAALHVARGSVNEAAGTSQNIIDRVLRVLADYYKLQGEQFNEFKDAERTLEAAKLALLAEEKLLDVESKLLAEKRKIFEGILETIEKNPELILGLGSQIDEQLRLLAEIADRLRELNSHLGQAQNALSKLQGDLAGMVAAGGCELIKTGCHEVVDKVCSLPGSCPALGAFCCVTNEVCDLVKPTNCADLEAQVSAAVQKVQGLEAQIRDWTAREAAAQARKAALEVEKAEKTAALAAAWAAREGAEAALKAQEELVKAQQALVVRAKEAVEYALKIVKEAGDALNVTKALIDEIQKFAQKYNLLTLFFANWLDGLDRAGDDYIQASLNSSKAIVEMNGDALQPYKVWLQCSLLAYAGVPWQLPYAICEVNDKFDEVLGRIEELKASLPPVLQWVLDPMGELREEVIKKAKPEVWKAAEAGVDFVMKPPAGRFIHFLADPKLVDADTLRDSYQQFDGEKGLIRLPNVVEMVDRDIALGPSGLLDPERFHALRNSVVLAKLSVLDARQLNQLFRDLAGDVPTRYGPTLYDESRQGRFSLLLDAVRSIDGNHQWQPFGLPYPREGAPQPSDTEKRRYGHSVHDHPHLGLRLFADPAARRHVFLRVFSGPIEGELLSLKEMRFPPYTHPACASNTFPRTVDDNGFVEGHDLHCLPNYHPAKWFDALGVLLERMIYRLRGLPAVPRGEDEM